MIRLRYLPVLCLVLTLSVWLLLRDRLAGAEADGVAAARAELAITPAPLPAADLPPEDVAPTVADGGLTSDLPRWWRSGALAGPIALGVYGLLWVGRALSHTRFPGLAWVRRKRVQATISIVAGGMAGTVLPLAVGGSLTGPGLFVAMTTIGLAFKPGGGEARDGELVPRALASGEVLAEGTLPPT